MRLTKRKFRPASNTTSPMPPKPMSSTRPGTAAYNRSRCVLPPRWPRAGSAAGADACPPRPWANSHCAAVHRATRLSTIANFRRNIPVPPQINRVALAPAKLIGFVLHALSFCLLFSKHQFQCDLLAAGRQRAADLACGGRPDCCVGIVEIRMIKRVKHFPAQHRFPSFRDIEVPMYSRIEVEVSRPFQYEVPGIAEVELSGGRKRGRIEPAVDRSLVVRQIAIR